MKMLSTICVLCMLSLLSFAGSSPNNFDDPKPAPVDFVPPTLSVVSVIAGVDLTLTDNSHDDYKYWITRTLSSDPIGEIILADSGSVYYVSNYDVESATTYTYSVSVMLSDMTTILNNVASITLTTGIEAPELKELTYPFYECGSIIELEIAILDPTAGTEIYRSLSSDGPFTLIHSSVTPTNVYLDDVKPATTFYYKARAAKNGVYSDFTRIVEITSEHDYYIPEFTATWVGNGVQVTLKDRTHAEQYYKIERYDLVPGIITEIYMQQVPDSGQVVTFIDYGATPNTEYEYILSGETIDFCEGWPNAGQSEISTIYLETGSSTLTINSFTLVDPSTDQDLGPLVNGAVIDGSKFPNIRANTDASTKCVMFFLNNKRHADNGPPIFTYFSEKNGDYKEGLSEPGHYILRATPSSEKNGGGTVGATVIIEFDVVNPEYVINSFTLVNPSTDQDVGPLVDGAVIDVSSLAVNIRANASAKTKAVMFFLNNKRHADNGAPVFTYFGEKNGDYYRGLWTPGHYVLKATPSSDKNATGIVGETVVIEFDVVCPICDARVRTEREAFESESSISLYPNPVVSESLLRVNASSGSSLKIQITDAFGRTRIKEIKTKIDGSGEWKQSLRDLNLPRGIYILHATINGRRFIERFIIE